MIQTQHKKQHRTQAATLIYAAFIAGLCSIIYELLIATTASYFLGDSVKYFSLTIGVYMAAMGVGSYITKYITGNILVLFVKAELTLGLLGGLSIPCLYLTYAYTDSFIAVYLFFTASIGLLIGLEIPFLTRLMESYNPLKTNIANILSFDYFGALIATTAFPFLLLPILGVYQTSLAFGLVNMSIGLSIIWTFREQFHRRAKHLQTATILGAVLLLGGIIFAGQFLKHWDEALYDDRIVHADQSPYQRIVMTKDRDDVRLYLNGNLQFSSQDEYRYHEALIHVPVLHADTAIKRVLLLGAGDGLAVRELLKYPSIEEIIIVDLDKEITELATTNRHITALNNDSLSDDRVQIIIADAFTYLTTNTNSFDFIIADLPDPNNNALARLYSKQFYHLVRRSLTPAGVFVTQATSPYFARNAFWSIAETITQSGFTQVKPYHAQVPSFGEWGFVMAGRQPFTIPISLSIATKFLTDANISALFIFGKDIAKPQDVTINVLDRPTLLSHYLQGWRYYAH